MLYPPREVERPALPQFSVRTLLVAVAAFALLLAAVPVIRQYLLIRHIRSRVPAAETSLEAGRAYHYALPRLSERSLKRLEADDNIGIALTAAYQTIERHLNVSRKPIIALTDANQPIARDLNHTRQDETATAWPPPGERDRNQETHGALVSEFLEFLEQRTGLNAPHWWEERIRAESGSYWTRPKWSRARIGVENGNIALADGKQITIGPDIQAIFHDDRYDLRYFWRLITLDGDRTFLMPYDDLGYGSPVLCIDSESGELIWRSENWALGYENLGRTSGLHGAAHITAELRGGTLVIWFAGDRGAYLEAYDSETGKSLYRFSTNLWFAR